MKQESMVDYHDALPNHSVMKINLISVFWLC